MCGCVCVCVGWSVCGRMWVRVWVGACLCVRAFVYLRVWRVCGVA